jgi:hypothetical protein
MSPISDALELLTSQHEELDFLVTQVQQTYDSDAFDELADKLVSHLALEQELFYPAIASAIPHEVQRELLAEHIAIKRVLADLVWLGVDDKEFGGRLAELGVLLDGHAGWQEDELFTTVAEALPSDRLKSLCTELKAFDVYAPASRAA